MKTADPVSVFVNSFAQLIAEKLYTIDAKRVRALSRKAKPTIEHKRKPAGHRMSEKQMRCRAPGCKLRSKGPRFKFLCAKHLKRKHLKVA